MELAPPTRGRTRAARPRRLAAVLALPGLAVAAAFGAAPAAAQTSVSANWGGYAVLPHRASTQITRVLGAWKQPAATCTPGERGYSAYWVGLGGYTRKSAKLEQIGTEADCSASGDAVYSAWYELVPAGPVNLPLEISPGDEIAAAVTVTGRQVVLTLRDETSGTSYSHRVTMSHPDTSSAEWIVEAPSECDSAGDCFALPLANFGNVTFTNATARTAAGHTGSIADRNWSAIKVSLEGDTGGGSRAHRFGADAQVANAIPASLTSAGKAFAVAWQQAVQPQTAPPVLPGLGGAGGQ